MSIPKRKHAELTPELKEQIINLVVDTVHLEEAKISQGMADECYHNTELLLRKYRLYSGHIDNAISDITQVDDDTKLRDLLELMGADKNIKIESVRESVAKSRVLVDHINKMLGCYEYLCKSTKKPEDARRYKVIKSLYIDDEAKTTKELASEEGVDMRTIQRDIQVATKEIGELLFGYIR